MSNLHNLKKEVEELEAQAAAAAGAVATAAVQHVPEVEAEPEIADDDPELKKYLCHPDSDVARYFGGATTVEAAKKLLAKNRHQGRLLATAANEALPLPQRIEAAVAWRSLRPAGNRWANMSDLDLVEALSVHPYLERLKELSALVCDSVVPKGADWRTYLQDQWAAISEFDSLRKRFPLRDVPVIISLEAVASGFIKSGPPEVRDSFTSRSEIYAYAKELQKRARE